MIEMWLKELQCSRYRKVDTIVIMIPAKYASKIGLYNVTVHSKLIKVRVVDNSDVVSLGISELKSEMEKNMVVAVKEVRRSQFGPEMILLCVKSRCLIIQVGQFLTSIPQCLIDFINNKEICFVAPAMSDTQNRLSSIRNIMSKKSYTEKYFPNLIVIDVGDLAAKVLQDPTLVSKKRKASKLKAEEMPSNAEEMQSIAVNAGVALEKDTIDRAEKASFDYFALVFSCEEIKLLIADVYASYLIAANLFDSL